MEEMAKGAEELNRPMFKVNRKMVASVDGGLYDPPVLVFNSSWDCHEAPGKRIKFNYPSFSEVQRPNREDDIAFVTAQRVRGNLIREVHESFIFDAFVGNATDWERVCLGNLWECPSSFQQASRVLRTLLKVVQEEEPRPSRPRSYYKFPAAGV